MKRDSRLLGFDDGPFSFGDESTPVVGVMTRGAPRRASGRVGASAAPAALGGYVEAVLAGRATVDGDDATDEIVRLLEGSGFLVTAKAIVFNGGALGGFNVLDLQRLHDALGLPVAAVMRDEPDDAAVRAALEKHFEDAGRRNALLTAQPIEQVRLPEGPCFVRRVGETREFFEELLTAQTVRGRTPEPLRIAHLIATAIAEGRSRGA